MITYYHIVVINRKVYKVYNLGFIWLKMEIQDPYGLFEVDGENIRLKNIIGLENLCINGNFGDILNLKNNDIETHLKIRNSNITQIPTYSIETYFKINEDILNPIRDEYFNQRVIHLVSSYLIENGNYAQPLYDFFILKYDDKEYHEKNKHNQNHMHEDQEKKDEHFLFLQEVYDPIKNRTIFLGDSRILIFKNDCSLDYYSGQYKNLDQRIVISELDIFNSINTAVNEFANDLKNPLLLNDINIQNRFGIPNRKLPKDSLLFKEVHNVQYNKEATLIKLNQICKN